MGSYILENRDTADVYRSEMLGAGGPVRTDVMVFKRKEDAESYAQKLNEIECDGRDVWFARVR